ncbi:hypothetical protein [Streptomyces chartreusis]
MRNVISTSSRSDVSEEYAERVDDLLPSLHRERETTQANLYGQIDFYVRLYTYPAPGTGTTMWAVDYSDPVSRELEETESYAEAMARYEEFVRDAAANLGIVGDGLQERFTTTDVDGVPGPLPELPAVTTDLVEDLLDQPGNPALYLVRSESGTGDEVCLQTGQEAWIDRRHVVLTRAQALTELGLDDGTSRITSESAAHHAPDYAYLIRYVAHRAEETLESAADALFPAPTS